MANMATRVQAAWDDLTRRIDAPGLAGVVELRDWATRRLLDVSRHLQPRLEQARANPVWQLLLDTPVEEFAVRRAAWDEFRASVGVKPLSFSPDATWEWATKSLWSLLVFIDPRETCDRDQFDLEVWVDEEGAPVFVCELGDRWVFRRRDSGDATRHAAWQGDSACLTPAKRDAIAVLFPDVPLLNVAG